MSILPVVSKLFERIMQKQINSYIEKYLYPSGGYRKGYCSQYALLAMIEQWKLSHDNSGYLSNLLAENKNSLLALRLSYSGGSSGTSVRPTSFQHLPK